MTPLQPPIIETDRDKLQAKISEASTQLNQIAKAAYGPKAGNVMLGFKHGAPMLSRDGVTNLTQARFKDPIIDDVAQAILQVSQKNNQKVGDGTTAVVILAHHLLKAAQRMESKGINPMEIAAKLKEAEIVALEYIDSLKRPLGKDLKLEDVATIAAGDKELGQLIADVMSVVGKDGGVVIEQYEGLGVHYETIDGFYFAKGYKDTELINDLATNQSNHKDVAVLVSNKLFMTQVDIYETLDKIHKFGIKELILIAEVNGEALELCKKSKASGSMMIVPVDPPYTVGGRSLFLDDIALMLGSTIYEGGDFDPEIHLGNAEEVLINAYSTTILGGDGDAKAIKERIKSLQGQLVELDHPQDLQFVKDRLGRLTGKMAIIKVGGAIEFERDEVKLRVQDAVCAIQSAMKEGVLPGGGVTLARIQGTEFDDAFKQPFKQLVENAGLNPEEYLAKLKDGDLWSGFNLRGKVSETPIDLLKEGILDPALVVKESVINATAIASGLITASAAIAHEEKM